ncbi:hypothetical protein [Emcibacter sp.]|uniref:hypothetical protein n=1 Tax=Emcibacter sp. TaxID=1979954 RepID=UPI003A8EEDD2
MSEIGSTQKPDFSQQDSPSRVTPTSTTSDQGTHQQTPRGESAPPEKGGETSKQTNHHDPAVALSASLLHLQAGSNFVAQVEGRDGEGRPIITTEKGTYVVQALPEQEEILSRLPPHIQATVQITSVDKEITATLTPIRTEKHASLEGKTFLPRDVTLTLIGVAANILPGAGAAPPGLATGTDAQYQASNLYKAEQIAKSISGSLDQIPLPTVTHSYTLFNAGSTGTKDSTGIGRTDITGKTSRGLSATLINSPVIAQETATPAAAGRTRIQQAGLETLLHKPVFATVIKTYPKPDIPLPAFVQKEIPPESPLDTLPKGSGFTLSVQSVAIPNQIDAGEVPKAVVPPGEPPVAATVTGQVLPAPATAAPQETPPSSTALTQTISGIVVDPGKSTPPGQTGPEAISAQKQPVPKTTAYNASKAAPTLNTHYLATPASVIKFESGTELPPGTIVTFSVDVPAAPAGGVAAAATGEPAKDSRSPSQAVATTAPISPPMETTAGSPPATEVPGAQVPGPAPQPLYDMLNNWQSLSLALSVLAAQQTTSVAALGGRLPDIQTPGQMTSGILFFMAALGAPNPARVWLGQDVIHQLQRAGQDKLIQQLDTDMRRIATLRRDTPPGDWRPVLLPLQTGPEVTAIPVLVRHIQEESRERPAEGSEEDNTGDKDKATRFILELDLKNTGNLILDGMLRKMRLDIILKTERKLPEPLREHLAGLFGASLQNNGFDGELVFQDGKKPDFSVKKLVETKIHFADRSSQHI